MGDDHAVSTGSVQRDPGENGHSQHPDGAADELTAEIRNLREEIAGLRAEVSRLNETLTERDTAPARETGRRPAPGLIVSVRSRTDRWQARWTAYRQRFQQRVGAGRGALGHHDCRRNPAAGRRAALLPPDHDPARVSWRRGDGWARGAPHHGSGVGRRLHAGLGREPDGVLLPDGDPGLAVRQHDLRDPRALGIDRRADGALPLHPAAAELRLGLRRSWGARCWRSAAGISSSRGSPS